MQESQRWTGLLFTNGCVGVRRGDFACLLAWIGISESERLEKHRMDEWDDMDSVSADGEDNYVHNIGRILALCN